MLIEEKPLQHWMDHFYGYGSWNANVWFISYEEGGGDLPEEVSEKLNYFFDRHANARDPTLCDIRELYKHVTFDAEGPRADMFTTLFDYRFGEKAILHGVWRNLISFRHGYLDTSLPDRLEYQKNAFASTSHQQEALIQLYPLPSPHDHAWYYSWVDLPQFPFLRRRKMYEEYLFDRRVHAILNQLKVCKPEVVVMYGMNNINGLKTYVQTYFPEARFRAVKGIKLETPQHHTSDVYGTRLVITTQMPALKHNRAETAFDWLEFGRKVRAY